MIADTCLLSLFSFVFLQERRPLALFFIWSTVSLSPHALSGLYTVLYAVYWKLSGHREAAVFAVCLLADAAVVLY